MFPLLHLDQNVFLPGLLEKVSSILPQGKRRADSNLARRCDCKNLRYRSMMKRKIPGNIMQNHRPVYDETDGMCSKKNHGKMTEPDMILDTGFRCKPNERQNRRSSCDRKEEKCPAYLARDQIKSAINMAAKASSIAVTIPKEPSQLLDVLRRTNDFL
ncbi:unnamed protein product [Dovyalis caffra]|uniref:Uncharacterized protein n=1 Tax=Dovyalis caffra TaxID=77055 RepID=A0AAV1RTR4_9ROSI|nr:unnamed protein product [Dovyalis caffra]